MGRIFAIYNNTPYLYDLCLSWHGIQIYYYYNYIVTIIVTEHHNNWMTGVSPEPIIIWSNLRALEVSWLYVTLIAIVLLLLLLL